jgi:polysaccharide biosynthesis protein PslJ
VTDLEPAPSALLLLQRDEQDGSRPEAETPGRPRKPPRRGWWMARVVIATVLLAAVCVVACYTLPGVAVGGVLALVSIVVIFHRALLSWSGLITILIVIVMTIPVRRFKVPVPLPFALEPYRVILAVLILGVILSLLVDPRFRWRKLGFGGSVAFFLATIALSLVANVGSLVQTGLISSSIGGLINYLFLFGVFYVTRLVLTSEKRAQLVVNLLSLLAPLVGFGAILERAIGVNIFQRFPAWIGLMRMSDETVIIRGGGARSFGSAQHPLALSVMLVMVLPLVIYQATHAGFPFRRSVPLRRTFWVFCAMLMLGGVVCTVSRTSFVVLSAMAVLSIIVRPRLFRYLVIIGIPAALLAVLVEPGVVLNMVRSFLNPSALIETQYADAGGRGSGRLADLFPQLQNSLQHPFFGTGVGSRIVVGPEVNALILDDQLLTTTLESGYIALIGLLVLFGGAGIRLWRFSRSPITPPRWADLGAALSVSIFGYLIALFFFDGFGFLQTVMVSCMFLALGGWLLTEVAWQPHSSWSGRMARILRRSRAGTVARAGVS